MTNQLILKGQHSFMLFYFVVADPATFLASNCVLGPYFPLGTACLFSYGKHKHLILIENITFLIFLIFFPKLQSAPLKWPYE